MSWALTADGHEHVVVISGSTWRRSIEWQVDGHLIASETTSEERHILAPSDPEVGVIGFRFPRWSLDARRVTLYAADGDVEAKTAAVLGQDGIDFIPAPGSAADKREARIRRHPMLHTLLLTSVGVARVIVPIILGLLIIRFAFTLPWPAIPWPSIPWPAIPWPDIGLPEISLPDWIREVLSKAKYVWPILLAFVLARGEVRRRRQQDALRQSRESLDHSGPSPDSDLG